MIIFPAILGLVLCLLNATGAGLFCLTTGCTLYSGYTLFGLSFYVYGAIGFGVISLSTIRARKRPRSVPLLGGIIFVGLFLDLLFLGWQNLYWPCSSCLVVALLLGGVASGFWRTYPQHCHRLFKGVMIIWLAMLIPVAVAVVKEVLLTPWALYGPRDASVRVFFSPTCPACASELNKLLQNRDVANIAFYPVARNDRDLRLLAAMLQAGVTQPADLEKLFHDQLEESTEPSLRLRWRLAKNKMALAGHGAHSIPLILSTTVLTESRQPWDTLFSSPEPPITTDPGGCGVMAQEEVSCK